MRKTVVVCAVLVCILVSPGPVLGIPANLDPFKCAGLAAWCSTTKWFCEAEAERVYNRCTRYVRNEELL